MKEKTVYLNTNINMIRTHDISSIVKKKYNYNINILSIMLIIVTTITIFFHEFSMALIPIYLINFYYVMMNMNYTKKEKLFFVFDKCYLLHPNDYIDIYKKNINKKISYFSVLGSYNFDCNSVVIYLSMINDKFIKYEENSEWIDMMEESIINTIIHEYLHKSIHDCEKNLNETKHEYIVKKLLGEC